MNMRIAIGACLTLLASLIVVMSCTKEKILQSEYVQEVQVVELPPDTVFVRDTIVTVQIQYDTVFVTDTVGGGTAGPNEFLAVTSLQYHNDPLVIDFIQAELGLNDGWIFYLSTYQLALVKQSPSVYDIAGYIDYWAPDWSGYYPLEFLWRITHTGGDPADPLNWQLSEPPSAVRGRTPGMRMRNETLLKQQELLN